MRNAIVHLVFFVVAGEALAAPPQISFLHPEYPAGGPNVITGEGFDPQATQIHVWDPKVVEEEIRASAKHLGIGAQPSLPSEPPEGSRRIAPLDVELQIVVASLSGDFVWIGNADGLSSCYLHNVPKPFWISSYQASPGETLHMFGFGLRARYRKSLLVLKGQGNPVFVDPVVESRSPRTADSRLMYFAIPSDLALGGYEVFIHNGHGGTWGWVSAGEVEITAPANEERELIMAGDHGAKGDGLTDDTAAIQAALAAAGNRGTVFFPAGTYRVSTTLIVPPGVTLRGAHRDTTIIEGFGYDPHANRVAWFSGRSAPPTSVIRLGDDTSLESLTVQGATSQGSGGRGVVEAVPAEITLPDGGWVRDVLIRNCAIRGAEMDLLSGRNLYRDAILIGPNSERVNLLENEIWGAVSFAYGETRRTEIIGNKIHGGAAADVVALGAKGVDCLVDANYFVDTPGRMNFCPKRHCYIRYNEIHQAFRGTWANAEEVYLVHGGMPADVGLATIATHDTLTDTERNWLPDEHQQHTCLITGGKGFGQYRFVTGNTKDTLRVDRPWRIQPDSTSEYCVGATYAENAFFANLNNTPCRMSLWLNCLANVVEKHRDVFAGGIDIWGGDRSQVKPDGTPSDLHAFRPSWYNAIEDCWLDGSSVLLYSGLRTNNLYTAPVHFGNRITRNRIRQPHMRRTGFAGSSAVRDAGIVVGNRSGKNMSQPQDARAGLSHTIIDGNFVSFTHNGVAISDYARKTVLTNNQFQEVDREILDWGARTIGRSNKSVTVAEGGEITAGLDDLSGQRELAAIRRPAFPSLTSSAASLRLTPDVRDLRTLVSQLAYAYYRDVESETAEASCQDNLRKLWMLIEKYETQHGVLPEATFFPEHPSLDEDSLLVLVGKAARPLLLCPTVGEDLQRIGLHYVWNQRLSGKKLSEITDPDKTWLVADFVIAHDWMAKNQFSGHRGGVNILYADGSVKRMAPFSETEWDAWLKR